MSAPRRLFRVALVGCGRIAHVHAGYLRQVPQVELVGACDTSAAVREAFTARWQLPTYADVEELLAAARPDAAHIVTPPVSHAGLAVQLLRAGIHVLVEKPMALSVAEADAMIAAARAAGCVLSADHNRWFDPVVQAAQRLIESGRLGTLVGAEVFQGAAAGEAEGAAGGGTHWAAQLPGGILFNLAPHPVYMLRGLVGAVQDLDVMTTEVGGQLRELRAVMKGARCLGGLTISMQAQPFMNRVTVLGTEMSAEVNLNNMTLVLRRTRRVPKLIGKVLPNLDEAAQLVRATVSNTIEFLRGRQRYYPGMGIHLRRFYEALANGQPPPVSADEGREAVWLTQRIWEQAGVSMAPSPPGAVSA
jgi:predicted dehydrogenase